MALYALKRTCSYLLYAGFAHSELLLGLVKLGLTGVNYALNPFPNFRALNRTDPSVEDLYFGVARSTEALSKRVLKVSAQLSRVLLSASVAIALIGTLKAGDDVQTNVQYLSSVRTIAVIDSGTENERMATALLYETTPFPHMSLQIGYNFYSYGFTYLSRQSVSQYFANPAKVNYDTLAHNALNMQNK